MQCVECHKTRHVPMLGLCDAYDAQVAALAVAELAERELLSDCWQCGAQLIRWANSPIKYEMDRQTVHACVVQQPKPERPRLLPPTQKPPVVPARTLSIRAIE